MVRATLSLKLEASHDAERAASEVATLSPRLAKAWRDATQEATVAIRASVVRTIVGRTSMGPATVEAITRAETGDDGANRSHGSVGLTKPPERFYPKTASALSFVIGGRRITVKSVRGSRPYKLVGRGAENALPAVERIYKEKVEEVLRD